MIGVVQVRDCLPDKDSLSPRNDDDSNDSKQSVKQVNNVPPGNKNERTIRVGEKGSQRLHISRVGKYKRGSAGEA